MTEMTAKRQAIVQLRDGDKVDSYFVLERKQLRRSRSGDRYGSLTLADATGQIAGRIWSEAPALLRDVEGGDIVRVEGEAQEYQGDLQIIVTSLSRMEKGYALRELVRVSERDVVHLYQALLDKVQTIGDPALRALLDRLFQSEEMRKALMRHPAAKSLHHAYLGGLLEHVMNVVEMAEALCRCHPRLHRDLLLAGVLLHDLGKLWELEANPRIDYTAEGRLLGHIALGYGKLMETIAALPDFPAETRAHLGHLILSHHGELAFGSPVAPATPEALALHHLENMDAQIQRFYDLQREQADEDWFYDRTKERWLCLSWGREEPGREAERRES